MKELKNCIVCGDNKLSEIFNFGSIYPSAFISDLKETAKFTKDPLVVNMCKCGMCQLKYVYEYDSLFKDYYYRSSVNKQMVAALQDIVDSEQILNQIQYALDERRTPIWVEIANNDGCMSRLAKKSYDVFMVGVDPALNLGNSGNDVFINDYFRAESVLKATSGDKADIVTCIACFYDLQDPHTFLKDVCKIMSDDGVFIIQLNDLWGKLVLNTLDDACQEHVAYYSLEVLDKLFKMNGLEIFDFEYNYVNGSSLRVYAGKTGKFSVRPHVSHEITAQKKFLTQHRLMWWFLEVTQYITNFKNYLTAQKALGKKIAIGGASTKGNTILQYSGLNNKVVDFALEVSPFKFGKYCLGSDIEIVDEKLALKVSPPDIICVMVWHFKESFLKIYKEFIENGGTVVFVFPYPHKVTKDGESLL